MAAFLPEIELDELYLKHYQPAKHPGDEHRTTRYTYLLVLKTLNDFFQFRWWLSVFSAPPREACSTTDLYADFEWWRDQCGQAPAKVKLSDCSDELVVGAMNWLIERGRKRTTANKLRRTVNCVWKFGARKCSSANVAKPDNEKYRVDVNEPLAFLPEELERILAAAARQRGVVGLVPTGYVPAGDWWLAAVLFIFSTGLRINAAMKVPTKKLDLLRGEILAPSAAQKQRKEQPLDLLPSAVGALRKLRLAERGVATVLGDWPWTTNTMRRHFTQLLVDAGIFRTVEDAPSELKFHALRKTLGSQIFAKAGIHAACDRLGHSSVEVTKRYIDPRYRSQPRISELVKDPVPTPPDNQPPLRVFTDAG